MLVTESSLIGSGSCVGGGDNDQNATKATATLPALTAVAITSRHTGKLLLAMGFRTRALKKHALFTYVR
jgi:hypothetical protein